MRITKAMLLRIATDIILVNLAFIITLALRYISIVWWNVQLRQILLNDYIAVYREFAWLLTVGSIVIFYLSGFYTYGRTYIGRYKALVIFQAVTVSYLLFGFTLYLFRLGELMPRSFLIVGWLTTLCLVGGVRVAVGVADQIIIPESRMETRSSGLGIRNVLVIGGAGYIGSILVRKLLQKGYRVRVLDALLYGDEAIRQLRDAAGFEFVEGDFRNVGAVVSCMRGIDAVIHLGAVVGDPACTIDADFTIEVNQLATRVIAEVSKGYEVQRFIFASTCSVYGSSDEILSEKSKLKPVSLYARTKMESEKVLLSLSDEGFCPIILRLATVYGMSYRPRFDLVVNLLAAKAASEKRITIFGGDQWRPFVDAEDAAEAFMKCLEAPLDSVRGEIFNVGSNRQNYRITQIGDLIKEAMPETAISFESRDVDRRNYRVNFSKIERDLNYVPRKAVKDGIVEVKEAIEKGVIGDYRSKNYSNWKSLSEQSEFELYKLVLLSGP